VADPTPADGVSATTIDARSLAEGFAAADLRGYHYRLLAALDEFGCCSPGCWTTTPNPEPVACRSGTRRSEARHPIGWFAGHLLVQSDVPWRQSAGARKLD
jgi:hypothetical protein